jgi:uncharacterized protein
MTNKNDNRFWKTKPLSEMTEKEWESLCDGCSKCCLIKIEDEDTGMVSYTHIVCRYMDMSTCLCTCYDQRTNFVPGCLKLKSNDIGKLPWLPKTCAYYLLSKGRDLQWWHPLVSGNLNTVHEAGVSVRGKVLREENVHPDDWCEHIIDWVDQAGDV